MDRRRFLGTGAAAGLLGGLGSTTALASSFEAAVVPMETTGAFSGFEEGAVRLNSNENPLGLSPMARRAVIERLGMANRYPREIEARLIEAVAARHGVRPENVVLGNGSTEILQMVIQASVSPRAPLVVADPTFEAVSDYRLPFPFELHRIPLTPDYAHDLGRMRDVAEAARRPGVVYICNPNNPTGTLTSSDRVDDWIADAPEPLLFLVDEAYFEYVNDSGYRSALPWIERRPNVVVARTFSKIFGMAGLRLGYGVAHPDTAARLREFKSDNNANQLALAAALASLKDPDLIPRSLEVDRKAKDVTTRCLEELGLDYLPSHTNFLMHRISGKLDLYIQRMAEAGLGVGRPFPPMTGWNRLSMGMPEEMERWAETLRGFRRKGWV